MRSKLAVLKQLVLDHQFACFIVMCVVVAVAMTGISLELYKKSGAIKLDMSRPGYEKVRKEVEKSSDDQPFDSSGKLDKTAVQDFEKRLEKYQKELDNLGDYSGDSIQDEDLNLTDTNQTERDDGAVVPGDEQQAGTKG